MIFAYDFLMVFSLWFFAYGIGNLGEFGSKNANPKPAGFRFSRTSRFFQTLGFSKPGFQFLVLMIDPLRAHYQFSSSSRISLRVIPTSVNSPYVMQCFEN